MNRYIELEHGETHELPGAVEVRVKGDWRFSWHLVVPFAFCVVGLFDREMKDRFYREFATALGSTIYIPIDGTASKTLIEHELVHVAQDRADGWLYRLGYLLSKTKRFRFELEAYTANIRAAHREGRIDGAVAFVARSLASPMYGSMKDFETSLACAEMVSLAIQNDREPDFDAIMKLTGAS